MNGVTQWEAKEIIREKNARITALEAENERLRAALGFYADPKHWTYVKAAGCNCIDADGGDIARAALAGKAEQ